MPQFILKINLGNDAMLTKDDIAERLSALAKEMRGDQFRSLDGYIRDINGNVCGTWHIK